MIRKNTLSGQLADMQIGDAAVFGADRYNTLKATASCLGFQLDRYYRVSTDRAKRTVTITREK